MENRGELVGSIRCALTALALTVGVLALPPHVAATAESSAEPTTGPTTGPTTVHRVVVAVLTGRGATGTEARRLTDVAAAASYWERETDGRVAYDLPSTTTTFTSDAGCGLDASFHEVVGDARAAVAADQAPVDVDAGDHLVVLVPASCAAGSSGRGTLGSGLASGGSAVVAVTDHTIGGLAHEWGHHYGLHHADVAGRDALDLYEVMGVGVSGGERTTALGTGYRDRLGLTTQGEVRPVVAAADGDSWTVVLAARSSDSGVRGLRLVRPDGGPDLWVDLRAGSGRDAVAAYAAGRSLAGHDFAPGLVVYADTRRGGVDVLTSTAATSWQVGGTWSEHTDGTLGWSITVLAVSEDGDDATARVEVRWDSQLAWERTASAEVTSSRGARVGDALEFSGQWSPAPEDVDYQWSRDGAPLAGATGRRYVPTPADLGHTLTVEATASAPAHPTSTVVAQTAGAVRRGRVEPGRASVREGDRAVRLRLRGWGDEVRLRVRWRAAGETVASGRRLPMRRIESAERVRVVVVARQAGCRPARVVRAVRLS
mgnify:CR=1 FL=1